MAPTPNASRYRFVVPWDCGAVLIVSTRIVPGREASWSGECPMTTASSVGPDSAVSPIGPACVPGKRSPSWSRGALRSKAANAGEA